MTSTSTPRYVDLAGAVRGPFSAATMRDWVAAGGFAALGGDLRVRRTRPRGVEAACGCADGRRFKKLKTVLAAAATCGRCDASRLAGDARDASRLAGDALVADYASSDEEDASSDEEEDATADLFRIVGYVDGLSDEIDASDGENWTTVPVVVEVKNRVNACRAPPLHEQLQVFCYLRMTGRRVGHLVQRVRSDAAAGCRVDRVALNDHAASWRDFCVPRLRALAEAVLALRADADRRRAWLRLDRCPRTPFNFSST